MKKILEVQNLVKTFGDFMAIDEISFDVKEGHVMGFLGPNGAGKSTTILSILNLIEIDGGSIRIFGKDINANRSETLAQMNYTSAEYNLPHFLTVREALNVFARLYGISKPKQRIKDLMDIFEISNLKNDTFRHLSFGQKARAGFCKALLNHPRLLLLDEPMASMDPDVVDKGITLLKQIQKEEKMTILCTSHNMWEIEEVTNEIILINHGKIVAQGSAMELTKNVLKGAKEPNLREVFLHISRQEQA